jgi:hypothetical protein
MLEPVMWPYLAPTFEPDHRLMRFDPVKYSSLQRYADDGGQHSSTDPHPVGPVRCPWGIRQRDVRRRR